MGVIGPSRLAAATLRLAALGSAAAITPLLVAVAVAQQEPAPPAAAVEPALSMRALNESRGLLESIGRLFNEGSAGFRSHVEGARHSFDDLNDRAATTTRNFSSTAVEVGKNAVDAGVAAADVTREAVGTVAKLPLTRVVAGRERCATAPNGAPDCQAAADALCRKQGYSSGKSVDFTSAEQCSPRTLLSGRQSDNDCATVTFISRAMCQ